MYSAFLYLHNGGHTTMGHYFLDEFMMVQSDPLIENIMLCSVEAESYCKLETLPE